MSEDAALPRETGAEKAPQTCPNCGAEVPAITTAYGGISGAACPVCFPADAPAEAPRQEAGENYPPRELGTTGDYKPVVE